MLASVSVAAATAALDADLLAGNTNKQSSAPRRLRGAALAGSAAALDTKVEIFKGSVKVGELYNSATGAPTRDHLFPIGSHILPNEEIQVLVKDAAATNPINLLLDFVE